MSRHYTYIMDERKIRIQLKSLDSPLPAQAWQKFEEYASTQIDHSSKSRFNKFEFNLSRNIVLPAIFGIMICVFSILLVNFISFKKPVENTINTEVSELPITTPLPTVSELPSKVNDENVIEPQNKSNEISSEQQLSEKTKTGPHAGQESPSNPKVENKIAAQIPIKSNSETLTSKKDPVPATLSSTIPPQEIASKPDAIEEATLNSDNTKEPEIPTKKKRKRTTDQQISDIRPTLVPDEDEKVVIPN